MSEMINKISSVQERTNMTLKEYNKYMDEKMDREANIKLTTPIALAGLSLYAKNRIKNTRNPLQKIMAGSLYGLGLYSAKDALTKYRAVEYKKLSKKDKAFKNAKEIDSFNPHLAYSIAGGLGLSRLIGKATGSGDTDVNKEILPKGTI